ncbi:MAG: hypothetical protein COZ31_05200 [Nitrospirae bacterium CG_4_10_14_3_um_filter_44_29]|nr:MAG: hypothetical protein COS28_06040 [Nitrospirae bacterium CG02_land_8_20_14_3_00_44_33]PIX88835.1 MAG: hypothetical protein COZ31_05200 [Nitrospirae bacterium CG_4_10_14_3_um_filter_44_29]
MKDKLIKIINEFSNIHLDVRFDWDFSPDGLPTAVIADLPPENCFMKNISLKKALQRHLPDKSKEMEYWIIKQWGGIRRFKKDKKNDERINALYRQLDSGRLSRDISSCISSFSKIASFYNPDKYAIYDARATFSLNWLLLKAGLTAGFFPVPAGQNTAITKYDIETVIRLKYGDNNNLFLKPSVAYFEYCNLLKELSSRIWNDAERKNMPYYLEMLLFVIAPREIVADMKQSINIEIRTSGST